MVGAVQNRLPVHGKCQAASRIIVLTQCAAQRHQSITGQAVRKQTAFGSQCGGDNVASHTFRQGHGQTPVGLPLKALPPLPVSVQQMSVAQIGNAGTAQLGQPRKRSAVGRAAQQDINPVAGALQWCTVMRRAEKDDVLQTIRPAQIFFLCAAPGAAYQQATHAVSEHREFLHSARPALDQLFQLT